MVDLESWITANDIGFASDASAAETLGYGAIFKDKWLFGQWEPGYIKNLKPSIEYLELFALTAGILTWGHLIRNVRILVWCDNASVVGRHRSWFTYLTYSILNVASRCVLYC